MHQIMILFNIICPLIIATCSFDPFLFTIYILLFRIISAHLHTSTPSRCLSLQFFVSSLLFIVESGYDFCISADRPLFLYKDDNYPHRR